MCFFFFFYCFCFLMQKKKKKERKRRKKEEKKKKRRKKKNAFERSWLTTESPTPVPSFLDPLCLQIASISSKIIIWRSLSSPFFLYSSSASLNNDLIFSSDWPTYLFRISGPIYYFIFYFVAFFLSFVSFFLLKTKCKQNSITK